MVTALDYETEYNARAAVPDHPQVIQRWRHDAAAYRAVHPAKTLRYGGSERCVFDIFEAGPNASTNAMALFIHGGYWQALDPSYFSHVAGGLNALGIDVAIAGYDLCPQVRIGDITQALRQGVAFLWDRARRPIVPFGHSAGGHLTAELVATDWSASLSGSAIPVTSGFAISGVFDLVPLVGTSINARLGMDEAEATRASSLFANNVAGKTLVSTLGALESSEFHRQTRLIANVWGAHGAVTEAMAEPGKNHFTVLDDLVDPVSRMTQTIARLCRA